MRAIEDKEWVSFVRTLFASVALTILLIVGLSVALIATSAGGADVECRSE